MKFEDDPRYAGFIDLLHDRLPEKKFEHCVETALFAVSFAPALGLELDAVVTAGLLHDLSRGLHAHSLIERAQSYGLEVGDIERRKPVLLHGPVAAEECRRELGITDEAIYEAIYWHTTGCPGLGRLGQAIYLADFAEPARHYPEAVQTRQVLERDGFDAALRYAAEVRGGLLLKKEVVHPISAAFHRWLVEELR